MIRHIRIIEKEVYERLYKAREDLFQFYFEQYKNDPNQTRYESESYNPNGMEFNYCKQAAWSEADRMTLGREIEAAKLMGRKDPNFKYEDCGCCHNMTIMLPTQLPDGNWSILIDIG